MTRRALALLVALALAGGLTACGAKDDDGTAAVTLQPLTLVLDGAPSADHAGLYAAQSDGALREAGLDVRLRVPGTGPSPLALLQAGRADVALASEPDLLLARDGGARLVAVGAVVRAPLGSLMAIRGSGVGSVAELTGKRVGTDGTPLAAATLRTILRHGGVDPSTVKTVDVGVDRVGALQSKRVDAVLGASWNQDALRLQRAHQRPTTIRVERAGVPVYDGLVLVARQDYLRTHGERVRRLLQALQAATRALRTDPGEGVTPLLRARAGLDRGLQTAAVRATLGVLLPAAGRPFGDLDSSAWRRCAAWLRANGLLRRPVNDAALTTEFLPGEGVGRGDDDSPG